MSRARTFKRPTFDGEIMREARTLAKLQRQARELRRKLKENGQAQRAAKKAMRALLSVKTDDVGEQMPPLRQFGERQGGTER